MCTCVDECERKLQHFLYVCSTHNDNIHICNSHITRDHSSQHTKCGSSTLARIRIGNTGIKNTGASNAIFMILCPISSPPLFHF